MTGFYFHKKLDYKAFLPMQHPAVWCLAAE